MAAPEVMKIPPPSSSITGRRSPTQTLGAALPSPPSLARRRAPPHTPPSRPPSWRQGGLLVSLEAAVRFSSKFQMSSRSHGGEASVFALYAGDTPCLCLPRCSVPYVLSLGAVPGQCRAEPSRALGRTQSAGLGLELGLECGWPGAWTQSQ